ncbi:sensor domain-containing diguanylate cyclase [Vibrio neonatus]|uniref:sensor domain-containing diguanylate cyclase n=1 Tax=Vibrio neonatus TaxID=278860 RepID=UPI0021C33650|nr:GGDEF domain-containing protein [Vibrio neonatus]
MSDLLCSDSAKQKWKASLFSLLFILACLMIGLSATTEKTVSLNLEVLTAITLSLVTALIIYRLERHNHCKALTLSVADKMMGVLILDPSLKVEYVNKQLCHITGFTEKQLTNITFKELPFVQHTALFDTVVEKLRVSEHWSGDFSASNPSGEVFSCLLHAGKQLDKWGKTQRIVITFTDISHLKRAQQKLMTLAEKDPLTKHWNRRRFDSALSKLSNTVQQDPSFHACLIIVDIDYFKEINDRHGHDEGDRVLIEVANTLANNSRDSDLVCRIGGEEFAVLMPKTNMLDAIEAAHRLKASIYHNRDLNVTVSCGVSPVLEQELQTYREADQALYQAKRAGRNRVMSSACSTQI